MRPGTGANAITLTTVRATSLSTIDRQKLLALCSVAFVKSMDDLFDLLPGSTHVIARQGDSLVGHACWVERWLQPNGMAPLRTAYVEAVAIHPQHQRLGIGNIVMHQVKREIRDYEIGGLGPANVPFYRQLGWQLWQGPLAVRMDGIIIPTANERVMVLALPTTPPLDLTASMSIEWRVGSVW